MSDSKSTFYGKLSPAQKKWTVYAGLGLTGAAVVWMMTQTTEPAVANAPVNAQSLTGGADVRAVTIEGIGERLSSLETSSTRQTRNLDQTLNAIQQELDHLRGEVSGSAQRSRATAREVDRLSNVQENLASLPMRTPQNLTAPPETESGAAEDAAGREAEDAAALRAAEERARRRVEEAERRRDQERREAIYQPGDAMPDMSPSGLGAANAPQISVYQSDRDPEVADGPTVNIQIPAGSIIPSVLITGLDAPTGTQASGQPMPVLFKIEKEAIMPNNAYGDVVDCHLLGAGYGELASERAYIRGETISCTLTDNRTVEADIKFYVAGADGKNGLPGQLVTRSGRMIAGAAGAATAQGIVGALGDSGDRVGLDALVGTTGGAIEGASEGFDMLAEYYIEMAEQTFPVIEVTNGRWVDVILTQGVELEWTGAAR